MLKKMIIVTCISIATNSSLFASSQNVATLTDIKESLSYLIDFHKDTQNRLTLLSSRIEKNKNEINITKSMTDKKIDQLEVAIDTLQNRQKRLQWIVNFSDCLDLKFKEELLDEKIIDFIGDR